MALDPEFIRDCPYGPEAIFFDDVLELDSAKDLIRVHMPTHEGLPLTQHQRVHPTRHPRHVNGGLMVHMTGMVAMAHVFFLHGLRHADGWIGYGALIKKARYPNLAHVGPSMVLEAKATRHRPVGEKKMIFYDFCFRQGESVVFESSQTAMFMKITD